MIGHSIPYNIMNNSYDPNHILQLQRLLAAQQAQSGFERNSVVATGNPLLDQYLRSNLHNRFPLTHPTSLGFTGSINSTPNYGMLQAMMMMNNERAKGDRERLLFLERANQDRATLVQERIAHQQRIVLNQELALKNQPQENLDRGDNFAYRNQHQETLGDRPFGDTLMDRKPTEAAVSPPDDVYPKEKGSLARKPKKKQDTKWLALYRELKEYKAEYGDCIVPRGFPLNTKLASWVAEQRKQYKLLQDGKNSSITEKRVELLDVLGFAWNAQEAAWDKHISDLKAFAAEFGDCLVPLNHPTYPKLGLWVKEQRRHHTLMRQGKPSHMTEERARALDAVGFCWDTHEAVWGERLRELCQYKAQFGDCVVPTNYAANPKLGTWVHHQRRQYKKFKEGKTCHITAERVRALESIGFVWYPRERSRYSDTPSSGSDTESDSEDLDEIDVRPKKRIRSQRG
jgi:hypothetical protein